MLGEPIPHWAFWVYPTHLGPYHLPCGKIVWGSFRCPNQCEVLKFTIYIIII